MNNRTLTLIFILLMFPWNMLAAVTSEVLTDGERLVYQGSSSRFLIFGNLGTIILTTTKDKLISKKDGFKIEMVLELNKSMTGLYSFGTKMSSTLDYSLFRSLAFNKIDLKNEDQRFEKAIFDYVDNEILYKRYRNLEKKEFESLKNTEKIIQDPLSLIYFLRTLCFDNNKGSSSEVILFSRGKTVKISMDYELLEMEILGKKRKVIHIKPSKVTQGTLISKRDIELYLDPETKIPLLIKILGVPIVGNLELFLSSSNHSKLKI